MDPAPPLVGLGPSQPEEAEMNLSKYNYLEIRPCPTQRQRKALKHLPAVVMVVVSGGETRVYHLPFEYNNDRETKLVNALHSRGFSVKGYVREDP